MRLFFQEHDKEDVVGRVLNDNILVVEDEGTIVGFIIYEIKEKHAKTMWVDQIIISDKYHKKGYGKKLMNKIYEIAKEENCVRVELECWSFNDNAIDMYKHLGFNEQRVKLEKKVRQKVC